MGPHNSGSMKSMPTRTRYNFSLHKQDLNQQRRDGIGIGCVCHVDLFRSTPRSKPERINQSLQAPRTTNEMAVSGFTATYPEESTSRSFRALPPLSLSTLMSGTDSRHSATSSGARPTLFESSNPRACTLPMPVPMPPTTILPFPGLSSSTHTVAMFSNFVDSSVPHAKAQVAVSDDDQNAGQASTYTTLLVGTRAVSASCVYHEGKKILAFVFSVREVPSEFHRSFCSGTFGCSKLT